MKILLTIGFMDILLPDDSGIPTMMKALSKGVIVRDQLYHGKLIVGDAVSIQIKTVPPGTKLVGEHKQNNGKTLALPEPGSILL